MISVVIPAYNEEGAIEDTVRRVFDVMTTSRLGPYEVIVVDDGSSDQTRRLSKNAGAQVIAHPHNVGYGKSLKDGIAAAKYDTVVITDADGTYPIEAIPELISEYNKGFDMVVGKRIGKHYSGLAIKTPLRWILKSIVEFTAGRKIPDINSGLRVFSRRTIMDYFPHLCDTFSFTTSLTLSYMMTSRFVAYVGVQYFERKGKTKVRLFRDALRTLQYIVEAATYYNPLKIFVLFALLCLVFAASSGVAAIIFQILSLFMLSVGSILMGMFMLGMGLLAVLLKQIMGTAKDLEHPASKG